MTNDGDNDNDRIQTLNEAVDSAVLNMVAERIATALRQMLDAGVTVSSNPREPFVRLTDKQGTAFRLTVTKD
jgi:hypothetical protein